MADIKVDYTFYTNTYGGTAIRSFDWTRMEIDARMYVSEMTFSRIYQYDLNADDLQVVQLAICKVADMQKESAPIGNMQSESTDGYSVTYRKQSDIDADIATVASRYLDPTTLTYRGIDYAYQR